MELNYNVSFSIKQGEKDVKVWEGLTESEQAECLKGMEKNFQEMIESEVGKENITNIEVLASVTGDSKGEEE